MDFTNYLAMTLPPKEMPRLDIPTPNYSVNSFLTADSATPPNALDYKLGVTIIIGHCNLDILNELMRLITTKPYYKTNVRVANSISDIPQHLITMYRANEKLYIQEFLQHVDKCVIQLNAEIDEFNTKTLPKYIDRYYTIANLMKD